MIKRLENVEKLLEGLSQYDSSDGEKIIGGVESVIPEIKSILKDAKILMDEKKKLEEQVLNLSQEKDITSIEILNKVNRVIAHTESARAESKETLGYISELIKEVEISNINSEAYRKSNSLNQQYLEKLCKEYTRDRDELFSVTGQIETLGKSVDTLVEANAESKKILDEIDNNYKIQDLKIEDVVKQSELTNKEINKVKSNLDNVSETVKGHTTIFGNIKGLFK